LSIIIVSSTYDVNSELLWKHLYPAAGDGLINFIPFTPSYVISSHPAALTSFDVYPVSPFRKGGRRGILNPPPPKGSAKREGAPAPSQKILPLANQII
jgi:hypothetical protein